MKEFRGKAGVIYVEQRPKQSEDDKPYEVWFEDFCILGNGDSDIEALQDARQHAEDIVSLISDAIIKTLTAEPEAHEAGAGG